MLPLFSCIKLDLTSLCYLLGFSNGLVAHSVGLADTPLHHTKRQSPNGSHHGQNQQLVVQRQNLAVVKRCCSSHRLQKVTGHTDYSGLRLDTLSLLGPLILNSLTKNRLLCYCLSEYLYTFKYCNDATKFLLLLGCCYLGRKVMNFQFVACV